MGGAELIGQISAGGYKGELFAVNPRANGLAPASGYPDLASIPGGVDLAVIVTPPASVVSVLEDCGKAGVTAAVVITSGFSEVGNHTGEEEVRRVAQEHGIRIVGPNCAGLANTGHHFFPTLELRPPAGNVALVSQSGALGGEVLGLAQKLDLGISKFVSYGNGIDLTQRDFLRFLMDDPETKVIALYVESVVHGREFMETLEACCRVKPVVVIKAGRTRAGSRATASHTGSMAGSDAVYDAAFRECGAVRVRSIEEMLDLCSAFSALPPMEGKRLGIVTNSGGPGVLAADMAEELGLHIPEPSPECQAEMRTFLPPHCSLKNPIDLTVEGTREGYRKTISALLPEVDAVLAVNIGTPYLDSTSLAQGVIDAATSSEKPVVANFQPEQIMGDSLALLKSSGIPNYISGERAVQALYGLAKDTSSRKKANGRLTVRKWTQTSHQSRLLPAETPMLEPQAMAWLGENGFPVPQFRWVTDPDQAVMAAEELGYPVVMKVVSPLILHKSDIGGVHTGIKDEKRVREVFSLLQNVAKDKDFRGVVMYPMLQGGVEVLAGLTTDPQFGPVVMFGLGGIYTEVLKDVAIRIAPLDQDAAYEMINEIRAAGLLKGARGKPACDLDGLTSLLVRLSLLPFDYPQIGEIDLNPVFVSPGGVVIGDVRVIRKDLQP